MMMTKLNTIDNRRVDGSYVGSYILWETIKYHAPPISGVCFPQCNFHPRWSPLSTVSFTTARNGHNTVCYTFSVSFLFRTSKRKATDVWNKTQEEHTFIFWGSNIKKYLLIAIQYMSSPAGFHQSKKKFSSLKIMNYVLCLPPAFSLADYMYYYYY